MPRSFKVRLVFLFIFFKFIMAKTLTKEISKLNKVPHPKGRKTAQLTKKAIKAAGRKKTKLVHQMKLNTTGEKLMWFQSNLALVDNCTPELAIKLIERYLNRFDQELKQIQLKHGTGKRKGRQHANREDIIKMTITNERNEYDTCGIEMPDILNPKQLNLLKTWSGELRYLQNFKFIRYNKIKLQSLKNSRNHLEENKESEQKSEANMTEEVRSEKIEEKKQDKMELD